jgi:PNKP adenylyltransferase domain, ligase domain
MPRPLCSRSRCARFSARPCLASAPSGAAAGALQDALRRGADVAALASRTRERLDAARSFGAAYRPYIWPVGSLDDVRLAPFQVLAGSAGTFSERDHTWHMANGFRGRSRPR